jgi:hypothetical protein
MDSGRIATTREHFILPSVNNSSSEIIEIKEIGNFNEIGHFRADIAPYMTEQSYQTVVRLDPINLSYSQHTTSSSFNYLENEKKSSSFAEKLRKTFHF